MKVIVFVLSVVCLSSARHVKWSSSDVDEHRDFKEQFHQFWSQLGDLLAERDEQGVKEFLHQTFQSHRPTHEGFAEDDVHHDMDKPNRPFKFHRPSYNENIMRPLHHEDFEQHMDEEMLRPLPPKPLRPLPNRPVQSDEEMYIMRPLDLPIEIDGEMEESIPQKHIFRPVRPVETEEMDNIMRPLPLKPLRPVLNRPVSIEDEKFIMRPLLDLPAEIDGEMEESVRPVEDMDNVMRPLPQKPLRPIPNRPAPIDDEKFIMRPLLDLPVEIDGEVEQSLPEIHIMRPLVEDTDNIM